MTLAYPYPVPSAAPVLGVVVAPVVSNLDDARQGTVTIRLPWGAQQVLAAPVALPGAGANRGFFSMPKQGDNVLVAFEGGDAHRPYVIGAIWAGLEQAPIANAAAADSQHVIRTKAGQEIRIDENTDKISIKTAAGALVECGPEQIKVDANGKGTTTLVLKADGSVELNAAQRLTLKAPILSLEATGQLKLSSTGTSQISGGTNLAIDAVTVRINS